MTRHLRTFVMLLLLALTGGCDDESATEIFVRVRAEALVSGEIDAIIVRVVFPDGTSDEVTLAASDLPFTVPIGPQDSDRAVTVLVIGTLNGVEVFRHETRTRFLDSQSILLDVLVRADCLGSAPCPSGHTCGVCGCVPIERRGLPQLVPSNLDPDETLPTCDGTDGGTTDSAVEVSDAESPEAGGAVRDAVADEDTSVPPPDAGDDAAETGVASAPDCTKRVCAEALSVGDNHACFIDRTGRLYCWGDGSYGQLGRGAVSAGRYRIARAGSASDWRHVSVSPHQTCGSRSGGDVYCWGEFGAGLNFGEPELANDAVADTALEAGVSWACGLTNADDAVCFGAYAGIPIGTVRTLPSPGGSRRWETLVDATTFIYVIDDADNLYTWQNEILTLERSGVQHASLNGARCMVTSEQELLCSGANDYGQAGLGSSSGNVSEGEVTVANTRFVTVATASDATCALDTKGGILCWGNNARGAMGPAAEGQSVVRAPVRVADAPEGDPYVQVEVGGQLVCGLRESGLVDCWGGQEPVSFGAQGGPLQLP